MIRSKELRAAIAAFGLRKIDDAAFRFELVAINAWGPEFNGSLVLWAERNGDLTRKHTLDLGKCYVRNGYTDAGRRFYQSPNEASYSRWEYAVDSHGSEAIYLPEHGSWRLHRDEICSLYAAAGMCDEVTFHLWFDAATSPVLVEHSLHGDTLSAQCAQDPGKKTPSWELALDEYTGRHNAVRTGGAVNAWPSVRRTMDALHRAIDRGEIPRDVAL